MTLTQMKYEFSSCFHHEKICFSKTEDETQYFSKSRKIDIHHYII
jgi:hypothetical protein